MNCVSSKRLFSGKWLLFRSCSTVSADWKAICEEIGKGNLWSAKVSLTRRSKSERIHLICVYTPNFYDVNEVCSVGILLSRLGLVAKRIYYKPDAFTDANIYADSGPASIYSFETGSDSLTKTSGFSRLSLQDQKEIDKAFESVGVSHS